MIKSKFSAPPIVVPSVFVIHLVNSIQFLNATCVIPRPTKEMSPLTKM